MNRSKRLSYRIMLGLAMMLLTGSMGCVGYVDDGGPGVVDTGSDMYLFGGYGWGHGAYGYGHRGATSRGWGGGGAPHGGGFGGHGGGGGGHGGR